MPEHLFELLRAGILAALLVLLLRAGRRLTFCQGPGWQLRHIGLFCFMAGEGVSAFSPGPAYFLLPQSLLTAGVALLAIGFWRRMAGLAQLSRTSEELLRSEKRYRQLVENQADFVVQLDHEGRHVFVSAAYCSLFGANESELLGKSVLDYVHEDDRESSAKALAEASTGAPSIQVEQRLLGIVGQRLVHWVYTPSPGPDEAKRGVVGVGRDITERRAAETEALRASKRYENVSQSAPVGLLLYRQEISGVLRLTGANPAALGMLHTSLDNLVGKRLEDAFPGKGQAAVVRAFQQVCLSLHAYINSRLEYNALGVNGIFSLKAFCIGEGEMAVFFENVTEREQLESQLENLALFDSLTGLPNRTLLLDRLNRALQRRTRKSNYPVAVLFIDLDRFKIVNDSLGHQAGDTVLREAAARIVSCVRSLDTVARFGGDEFVVLLEEFDVYRTAVKVVRRVQEVMSQPIKVDKRELVLGASIGVALAMGEVDGAEELLRKAEIAMHRAKELGRNRFKTFTAGLLRQTERRVRLEQDIDKALELGQFYLVFQPVVRLDDGVLTGFECLVRWNHPELGNITPSEFIPLAEESGKIVLLDRWILDHACRTFVSWRERFPQARELSLSVNLSAKHLPMKDFTAQLLGTLAETGMPAEQLKLEITETSLMVGGSDMARKLQTLRAMGVRFSIDDFGTGYSSMAYLNHLPVDDLKLDIQFVRHLETRLETQQIVRAILTLAQGLGLVVVAEGVEVAGQRDTLRDMGCEMAQGFLIARPMTIDQVEAVCFGDAPPAIPQTGREPDAA